MTNLAILVLGVLMFASVLAVAAYQELNAKLAICLVVAPACFFAVVVGLNASNAIRKATDDELSPRSLVFLATRAAAPRWFWLWGAYLILLELALFFITGGLNLILSLPSAGLALSMLPAVVRAAKHFRSVHLLTGYTLIVPLVIGGGTWLITFWFFGIVQVGYMGLGRFFLPPMMAGVVLTAWAWYGWASVRTEAKS